MTEIKIERHGRRRKVVRVRDAQHSARLFAIEHEVGLRDSRPTSAARAMARHRIVRMAEPRLIRRRQANGRRTIVFECGFEQPYHFSRAFKAK